MFCVKEKANGCLFAAWRYAILVNKYGWKVENMSKLSKRQIEIFDFIKKNVKEKGYPPSVREIAEAVGLSSSSTVHGHLAKLENKGLIRRDPTKPRAIEILEKDENGSLFAPSRPVPVIGKVTAGLPITAVENIEDYFPLPEHIAPKEANVFMLEVVGDSMIEAGILDGDYVVVRQQNTAENGEIVVAMTEENEATVKRFYKEKNHIRLQPANSQMELIIVRNVTILGKVIGVFRYIDG